MSTRRRNLKRDIEIFKVVTDHLKQDTEQFWIRANFFLLANAGLLSAFVVSYPNLSQGVAVLRVIPILGALTAIFWLLVLRGSIKWIRLWREQVMKLDEELDPYHCYSEVEAHAKREPFSSPSFLTQFLPLVFVLAWAAIFISTLVV
jgi:hypothetical protein